MEVRNFDPKVFHRFKADEIPSNWYVPADKVYEMMGFVLYHWGQGHKTKGGMKGADKMLYQVWEYIEEHAFAYGKEIEDGTAKSE